MMHFRNSQGEHRKWLRSASGHRGRWGKTRVGTDPGKVSKGQQNERHVPVPSDKASYFIVIQAQIFAVFKSGKRPGLSYLRTPTSPHRTGRTPFSVSGSPGITFAFLKHRGCRRDQTSASDRIPHDGFSGDNFDRLGFVCG